MFLKLLVLFVVLPIIELVLLIKIGRTIDVGPTIALVIVTGVVGAALARHQGLRTLARVQEQLGRGTIPAKDMVDGLMILVAGAVLMTPGVITDCFGFALLIPPARALVRNAVINYFKRRMTIIQPPHEAAPRQTDGFIDVDAREVGEKPPE